MNEISPQQLRFWNELKLLLGQIEVLDLYELRCERIESCLKVFLALVSSGSIGAWVIWQAYHFVWAGMIAGSQIVTAVKPLLPFEKRRKATGELSSRLKGLFVEWEAALNQVREGNLTDAEIASRLAELKRAKYKAADSCLKNCPLPEIDSLNSRAEAKAENYFRATYGEGEENGAERAA